MDAKFKSSIFRYDQPMVIAMQRHLATIAGFRMKYQSAGYAAGQVLEKDSVSGFLQPYSSGDAVGILFQPIAAEEFAAPSGTSLGKVIVAGYVYKDALTGWDSGAAVDLKASELPTSPAIIKF